MQNACEWCLSDDHLGGDPFGLAVGTSGSGLRDSSIRCRPGEKFKGFLCIGPFGKNLRFDTFPESRRSVKVCMWRVDPKMIIRGWVLIPGQDRTGFSGVENQYRTQRTKKRMAVRTRTRYDKWGLIPRLRDLPVPAPGLSTTSSLSFLSLPAKR